MSSHNTHFPSKPPPDEDTTSVKHSTQCHQPNEFGFQTELTSTSHRLVPVISENQPTRHELVSVISENQPTGHRLVSVISKNQPTSRELVSVTEKKFNYLFPTEKATEIQISDLNFNEDRGNNEQPPGNINVRPSVEAHPFAKHYSANYEDTLLENPAERITASVTLGDVQEFREASLRWSTMDAPEFIAVKPEKVNIITSDSAPENKPFALFIIIEHNGGSALLTPVHKELAACDRPDLHLIQLTRNARNLNHTEAVDMVGYLAGDLVCVTKLQRRLGAKAEDIEVNINLPNIQKITTFWQVEELVVIHRKIIEKTPIQLIKDHRRNPRSFRCIVLGLSNMANGKIKVIRESDTKERDSLQADVFVPVIQPGQLLRSVDKTAKEEVYAASAMMHHMGEVSPLVLTVQRLNLDTFQLLKTAANAFANNQNREKSMEAIATAVLFGLSGVAAMVNKDVDRKFYTAIVSETRTNFTKPGITFSIRHLAGPPSSISWAKSTCASVRTEDGWSFTIEVISAFVKDNMLEIKAKITSPLDNLNSTDDTSEPTEHNIRTLTGKLIVIHQDIEDNDWILKAFPKGASLCKSIQPNSNADRIINALYGGPAIPINSQIPTDLVTINHEHGQIDLSREQSIYANSISQGKNPMVIADSPFGVGKTLMVVAAANEASRRSKNEFSYQLAIGITNASAAALVSAQLKADPTNRNPTVRLVSTEVYDKLDEAKQTPLDYPTLWPKVLNEFVQKCDDQITNGVDVPFQELLRMFDAAAHLNQQDQLHPGSIRSEKLKTMITKQTGTAKYSLLQTFMSIYRPKFIIGTVTSIISHFSRSKLSPKNVETIQIEEANQLPIHSLITLLSKFPDARFALVGDKNQLPPYQDSEMPHFLADHAIGRLLEDRKFDKFPRLEIRTVRRCPKQIIYLCSKHFYNNELVPHHVTPSAVKYAKAIGCQSYRFGCPVFPIQVMLTTSNHINVGCSLVNTKEAQMAIDFTRKIHRETTNSNIAILCFYKAQAAYLATILDEEEPYFVGTINSSQSQEWNTTIVLTTRSEDFSVSQFLHDPKRINVALSRTKGLCIVFCHPAARTENTIWKPLLRDVPAEAFNDPDKLMRNWTTGDKF